MKAFPTTVDNGHSANQDGMELRDYFAAKAMQGLLASDVHANMYQFAARAYEVADAMIKARK